MQELYYGRHGQTVDLSRGIRSRPDTVLTPQGWDEARRAGGLLLARAIMPSLIVCSELPRSVQSGQAVAEAIGYDPAQIIRTSLLNERDCGEATGILKDEIKRRWPEGFDTVPGAETVEALQQRAGEATAWLKAVSEPIVLVMGHGTIGRAIVREFEDRPFTDEYSGEQRAFRTGQIAHLYPQPTTVLSI